MLDSQPKEFASAEIIGLHHSALVDSALGLLEDVLTEKRLGEVAMVSSFGAESAALLHLVSRVNRAAPVIFIDTHMHFRETLEYQLDLANMFGLSDIRRVSPDVKELAIEDPENLLHRSNTDECCDLRKVRPLESTLEGFDGWITGRKRFQTGNRQNLKLFELDNGNGKVKVNPLAFWDPMDVKAYFERHDLPPHPLVKAGYPSIGCEPCTSRVEAGQDPRSGRWAGSDKDECGIHIVDGRIVRTAA